MMLVSSERKNMAGKLACQRWPDRHSPDAGEEGQRVET